MSGIYGNGNPCTSAASAFLLATSLSTSLELPSAFLPIGSLTRVGRCMSSIVILSDVRPIVLRAIAYVKSGSASLGSRVWRFAPMLIGSFVRSSMPSQQKYSGLELALESVVMALGRWCLSSRLSTRKVRRVPSCGGIAKGSASYRSTSSPPVAARPFPLRAFFCSFLKRIPIVSAETTSIVH